MNFPALGAPQDRFGRVVLSVRALLGRDYKDADYATLVVRSKKAGQCLMIPISPEEPGTMSGSRIDGELAMRSHDVDGIAVHQRGDAYVNATQLCKAGGKEWASYYRNDATKEFMAELEGSLQICRDQLIQGKSSGPNELRGTWVHPLVAIT